MAMSNLGGRDNMIIARINVTMQIVTQSGFYFNLNLFHSFIFLMPNEHDTKCYI